MDKDYRKTLRTCFIGYVVQGMLTYFCPLLFLTFSKSYGIPLSKITVLITVNFMLQLTVDLFSVKLLDKLGYRVIGLLSHFFAALGLILLAILPNVLPDPYIGLVIAVLAYAVGGGLLEVLVSPMVEACPTKNKEKTMSLLHSFFCWGSVGTVLLSTAFFKLFGIQYWPILSVLWALIPIGNGFSFLKIPIYELEEDGKGGMRLGQLIRMPLFWGMMVLMLCAGAAEIAVSQWASTFAEKGLGVTKAAGDLAGPAAFALLMGLTRLFYGRSGDKLSLSKFMIGCAVLCIAAYLIIALSPDPVLGLIGCGLCGLSVAMFWPGTLSLAAKKIPGGGTKMFALFALAGDSGCTLGPTLVGLIASACGERLQTGILVGTVFPVILLCGLLTVARVKSTRQ